LAIGYLHYNKGPIEILSHHAVLAHDHDDCPNWVMLILKLVDSEFNKLSIAQSRRMSERRKPLPNFDAVLENKKEQLTGTPILPRTSRRQLPVLPRLIITTCHPKRWLQ
jgi:hypothetical protein